jgi:hypothetical protein
MMEYPEPYHSTPRHLWRGLERDREKNPNRVPRPFDLFDEPEPKKKFSATCRKFGNAEELYGTAQVPPDRP